jgi:hypothetical protein
VYQSGIAIADIKTDSEKALRGLVERCVERALDEQKANARGVPPLAASFTKSEQTHLYARHEFVHGVWCKMTTSNSRQPISGFTVPSSESRTQVEMLRAAYEVADGSMRQVIRRLAQLSIEDSGVPSRRYTP